MAAGEVVGELLERARITKSELSARSGVSRSLIDDYLKDRRHPSLAQLERLGLAAGYRLDVAWADRTVEEGERKGSDPTWLQPYNPAMRPPPLTVEERAQVLERVAPAAMAMRRGPRGELGFPPFRTLGIP